MKRRWLGVVLLVFCGSSLESASGQSVASHVVTAPPPAEQPVRVAAAQAKRRSIDWRLKDPVQVLEAVNKNLAELEQIVHKAGKGKCDALALPEDTLGLLDWVGVNEQVARDVLPVAVERMLKRLGRAAAAHRMYLVVCSDYIEADGGVYNTAFLLGREGNEIGRYHKVCPTWFEGGTRRSGRSFPVFRTPDLGTVGLVICYDLVIPETARCLALEGADILFFPTMGTAAVGDDDIGLQALRVRAAENHVWLVVAHRGEGAMIISPRGKIVAQAEGPDGLAIADIDPLGGREGGDSANYQKDMRARLFRERNPEAFGILTSKKPPALDKLPIDITREEGARIMARMLTVGEEEFRAAAALARAGNATEAITAFLKLRAEYKGTWIDRAATERVEALRPSVPAGNAASAPQTAKPGREAQNTRGLAAKYPRDAGIGSDPRVVFSENFEAELDDMKKKWSSVDDRQIMSLSDDRPGGSGGQRSLLMTHMGGKGSGGSLYRTFKPGFDRLFARFYVKFDPECAPIHHFGTNIGGYNPPTPWPQGGAGLRPGGAKTFTVGVEPFGDRWVWDYYAYWCEMRGSPPNGQTWGNSFIRDPTLKIERGKWICVEVMVKMNTLGESNGELALWIDGRIVSQLGKGFPKGRWEFDKFNPGQGGAGVRWSDERHGRETFDVPEGGLPFEGFRWRTTKELNLNYLWVYLYITKAPEGHISRVWFDDIVVATDYIGPIEAPAAR
jgi:predicted amidohydrolase